jgi:hypothetical protein
VASKGVRSLDFLGSLRLQSPVPSSGAGTAMAGMDARTRALSGYAPTFRRLTALTAIALLAWVLPARAQADRPGLMPRAGAASTASSAARPAHTRAREEPARRRRAAAKRRAARRKRERKQLERRIARNPTLILDSKVRLRVQALGARLPLTLRLRRAYEAFPGDDTLQLAFDDGAIPWPLPGTVKPAAPVSASLDGAVTMEADYGADTSAYPELGTVETIFGGGTAITSTGFQVADQDPGGCTTTKSLTVTAGAFSSAGPRFGILNPFSRRVYGTVDLRPTLRVVRTACDDSTATWDVATSASDRALPVAFDGDFRVSPGVSADGRIRWGVVTVNDATSPQRTTFGMVYACTDPAAGDGCDRRAFPVRTKLVSMVAEVLVGDAMPAPASLP